MRARIYGRKRIHDTSETVEYQVRALARTLFLFLTEFRCKTRQKRNRCLVEAKHLEFFLKTILAAMFFFPTSILFSMHSFKRFLFGEQQKIGEENRPTWVLHFSFDRETRQVGKKENTC